MISIKEFCELHNACAAGRAWALANCQTMMDVWATARSDWLVWVATRPGVLDDRTLRLFAVHCARSVEYRLTDHRSLEAISIAERFAHGDATSEELSAAWDAGWAAAVSASGFAWGAVRSAAWAAAVSASDAAVSASHAARASDAQAEWLRRNAKPNF